MTFGFLFRQSKRGKINAVKSCCGRVCGEHFVQCGL